MPGKINMEDLPPEVLEKLGLKSDNNKPPKMIKPQMVAMGGVLVALKGLKNREALWVLRTVAVLVRGYRVDKQRNPATTLAGRKKKIVDDRQ